MMRGAESNGRLYSAGKLRQLARWAGWLSWYFFAGAALNVFIALYLNGVLIFAPDSLLQYLNALDNLFSETLFISVSIIWQTLATLLMGLGLQALAGLINHLLSWESKIRRHKSP